MFAYIVLSSYLLYTSSLIATYKICTFFLSLILYYLCLFSGTCISLSLLHIHVYIFLLPLSLSLPLYFPPLSLPSPLPSFIFPPSPSPFPSHTYSEVNVISVILMPISLWKNQNSLQLNQHLSTMYRKLNSKISPTPIQSLSYNRKIHTLYH